MALFKNWVQLTDEQAAIQESEKKDTLSFESWVTERNEPTVATPDSPIVSRWTTNTWAVRTPIIWSWPSADAMPDTPTVWWTTETGATDIRIDKIWEILSAEERRQLIDSERNRIRWLQNTTHEERTKQMRKLTEDIQSGAFFGGETQMDAERTRAEEARRQVESSTKEALSTADDVFRQELERDTRRIQEQGKKVMDTTQRLNSLRGGGRSSANEADITKQQGVVNELVSVAQSNADLKLQKRRMQIEWASADAMSAINESLRSNEKLLNDRIDQAVQAQSTLDAQIGLDFTEKSSSLVWLLAASWVEVWDYDEKASIALGYISDSKGIPLKLDTEGNPMAPKNQFGMDSKITNFKDANDNTYVYTNWELTSIIDNQGNILQWDKLDTVKVPAQVEEDKTIAERRKTETALRNEFIKRPEVKRYQEIRAQFERVKQGADANNASGDIALVFSFMKMLDPGSVVRESEFATAQNAAGVPDQVRNMYNKVLSGTRLWQDQRVEFKTTAENLLKSETSNFEAVKNGFKTIIEDAGARSEFVLVWEDIDTQSSLWGFSTEQEDVLWQKFGSSTTTEQSPGTFSSPSGKTFNIPQESGLTSPDKTGWTNDLSSFIKSKEWFRSEAYKDSAWVWTLWYWATKVNWKPVQPWDSITKQQWEEILQADIARHSNFKNLVTVPLSPEQQIALSSFEFNLWPNIWKTTWKDIIDNINSGNIDGAVKTMLAHNKARDKQTGKLRILRWLNNRRREEADLLKMNT